jgi:uncharacterized protein (TIGR03085 family)
MTRLARSERTALCDLALQVGEDQPTLCEGWTVKDLVVHLLVREGSPAAVGISVSRLSRLTDRASARLARKPFESLVERLRSGPPRLSPFAIPKVDDLANSLEFFVHHEDVRRAQPGWVPRELGADTDGTLWSMLRWPGKALARRAPVGVTIEDTTTGGSRVLSDRTPGVTVRGPAGEVAMFLFGRTGSAQVELLGDDDAVRRLRSTSLGI